ncbi:MAG TPA: amino acid ABC transporter substrate-binding protein [Burkholderiales bacterium]|nr:amino acid ABC transporter substrate-binding protein [Burkholderiales bacterium]
MLSMTSWITRALFAFLAAATAHAADPPLVVGAVVSQSGAYADLAQGYRKGLLVWQDEVNAGGGLLGRQIELRLLDDGSEATRNSALYQELIHGAKADALIGPFGTAATLMAAPEAENSRRVMVNGAGSSLAVHQRLPRYVFQSAVPYASYGAGVLEIAREQGYRSLFILARDDLSSQEMAESTRESALKQGFTVGPVETYGGGLDTYAPQVVKAINAQADAWIAFGPPRDAADMVKTFKKVGYAPKLFFARAAAEPKFIELVGQDAEFSLAAADYHPRLKTHGNDRFVKLYSEKWSTLPGAAAAEGYAAGTVLAEALRRAGSADQEKLREALAALELDTVLGRYKVDPKTGEQTGIKPAVVQIERGRPLAVWPEALQAAKPVLPYPQWNERRVLR